MTPPWDIPTERTSISNKSQKPEFTGFRGRQGAVQRRSILTYTKRFLGFDTEVLLSEWEDTFNHYLRNEGKIQAVRRMKDLYNFALRWSCGVQTDPLPFVGADADGVPKKLKNFKRHLLRSSDSRRAALTILQCFKLEAVEPPYSLESITKPYGGKNELEWVEKFKQTVSKEFPPEKLSERISKLKPGYHISGSNGPNGPSLGTAHVDREAIRGTAFEESVKKLSLLTKFKYLSDLLAQTQVPCETNHRNKRKKVHSRIRIKYEPGGKARPFAIGDFFSQSALKSIHDYSMNQLKSWETDSTANHSFASKVVREWSADDSTKMWSYDLTSATDRFPVFLQLIVLEHMFGKEITDCWRSIILDRTFEGPNGENVRFEVGQPLGLLSSWAVFSITHHLLVQTAAFEVTGTNQWFRNYRMIGDDICIAGSSKIATRYKCYLDDLDVNISVNKSILPEQCSKGNAAEIAKRLFHKGVEVTPVPPLAIIEGLKTPQGLKNLIENSWDRGYYSAGSPYPVQSIPMSPLGWATLTFPIRNRSPQLNGVRSLFPSWELNHEAPAGLSTGWFIWYDVPDELMIKAVRRFLFDRVNKAVADSQRIQQQILLARYSKSEREDLPQGGDWQPGTFDCHPEILTEVFSELQEILMKEQSRLWNDNILQGDVIDLYSFIGNLHKYLEPKILLTGRTKFIDEKSKTLIFISALVKYVSKFHKSGDWSELEKEPEVESFPIADELEFALFDLPFEE